MAAEVSVRLLAAAKAIPEAELRSYGLVDVPGGVQFEYLDPGGRRGRSRLRTGLRGQGGSAWPPYDRRPVVAYSRPASLAAARSAGYQIVVEGESDCWAAWHHGFPAVGIPGAEHVGCLEARHFAAVCHVFVQVEEDHPATFPAGVEAYLDAVRERVQQISPSVSMHRLTLPAGVADLADLHGRSADAFTKTLRAALDQARARDWRASPVTGGKA
jgi:putative DNA primase/helicase